MYMFQWRVSCKSAEPLVGPAYKGNTSHDQYTWWGPVPTDHPETDPFRSLPIVLDPDYISTKHQALSVTVKIWLIVSIVLYTDQLRSVSVVIPVCVIDTQALTTSRILARTSHASVQSGDLITTYNTWMYIGLVTASDHMTYTDQVLYFTIRVM